MEFVIDAMNLGQSVDAIYANIVSCSRRSVDAMAWLGCTIFADTVGNSL